jgi:hypothetical protein
MNIYYIENRDAVNHSVLDVFYQIDLYQQLYRLTEEDKDRKHKFNLKWKRVLGVKRLMI